MGFTILYTEAEAAEILADYTEDQQAELDRLAALFTSELEAAASADKE